MLKKQKPLLLIANLYAILVFILFVSLALIGLKRGYSEVPFYDSWFIYDPFYLDAESGDLNSWIAPHNEHRILITRLLFFIDLKIFGGKALIPFSANIASILLGTFFLYKYAKSALTVSNQEKWATFIALCLGALLFSWVQKINIIWAFQNQFLLVSILPFGSLWLLAKSAPIEPGDTPKLSYFSACILLAATSLFTMANAIFIFPVIIIAMTLMRFPVIYIFFAFLGTLILTFAYLTGIEINSTKSSGTYKLFDKESGILNYTFNYLANPFLRILSFRMKDIVSVLFALILIFVPAYVYFKSLFQPKKVGAFCISLSSFILFIGLTAGGTAFGRIYLGMESSYIARYASPPLLAWAALLILITAIPANGSKLWRAINLIVIAGIPIAFMPYQLSALETYERRFDDHIAILALEMDVNDSDAIYKVAKPQFINSVNTSRSNDYSIFGFTNFNGINEALYRKAISRKTGNCEASLNSITKIAGDNDFLFFTGDFTTKESSKTRTLRIINQNSIVVGFAVVDDRKSSRKNEENLHEFSGYVSKKRLTKNIYIGSSFGGCDGKLTLP